MPPEVANQVNALLSWLAWAASAACVLGVLAAAARMAVSWSQGNTAGMQRLAAVAGACVLAGSAAAIVAAIL